MSDALTSEQLDAIADRVRRRDTAARIPQSPVPKRNLDSFLGRAAAAQEAARLERRRAMDEANARARAEAQAAAERAQADAERAQADADAARRELARLAGRIRRREADRRDTDAKATVLYRRDRDKHRGLDELVKDLKARAAAVPPRKETP